MARVRKNKYRFSVFTFDAETGVLTRNGYQQRVSEQTSRVLEMFVERAGELVTREELQLILWPGGEIVDYDQGINTAINKLRHTLRDDPKNPRFIETVPKRGYSFKEAVHVIPCDVRIDAEPVQSSAVSQELTAPLPTVTVSAPAQDANNLVGSASSALPERASMSSRWKFAGVMAKPKRWFVVTAVLVVIAATLIVYVRYPKPSSDVVALGIAPFQARGPEAEQIENRLRLELTDALSQLPGVQVRAAELFASGKQDRGNVPAVLRDLHVDQVLMGRLTIVGETCDLQLELVGSNATHLGSFEYSGSRTELRSMRDRVQRDLFHYFQSHGKAVQSARDSTNDPLAFEEYLKGRYYAFERSPESLNKALAEYEKAIARDPNFANAYGGMATAYLRLSTFSSPGDRSIIKAQDFARLALQKDPNLAEAHAVLGYVAFTQNWDAPRGEKELRYAIELDPGQAAYHVWLSVLLSDQGRFDESLREIDLAHGDDPRWPSVWATESLLAANARQVSRSIEAAKKYVEMLPSWPMAHDQLAWSYFLAGQRERAIAEWRLMGTVEKDSARVTFEDKALSAFRQGGIRAYAQAHLDAMNTGFAARHPNDFAPADWYACAGKRDAAIAALQDQVSNHTPEALQLAVNPLYEDLHDDPRFLALLTRVGLALPKSHDTDLHLCQSTP
jgi:DNA-binding winged helix-turn-helix (wHTH) protein/tetratricopeptide (TPR) repeat protein